MTPFFLLLVENAKDWRCFPVKGGRLATSVTSFAGHQTLTTIPVLQTFLHFEGLPVRAAQNVASFVISASPMKRS
jgi:hypothetical protein